MNEAVIVSTVRSPIGRAGRGSLTQLRPDDMAVQMVQAALADVPALDTSEIVDLLLGCANPAGEMGLNLARTVSVLSDLDHVPGVTMARACASSLQTTRAAAHAIRAGEGDAFLSVGVESVSRLPEGYLQERLSWAHPPICRECLLSAPIDSLDGSSGGGSLAQSLHGNG